MASGRLTRTDIDQIFAVFDADNSGTISSEEYRTALLALGYGKVTTSEAAAMMGDKAALTREEFAQIIQKHSDAPNSRAEAKRAFKLFDPRNTGRLTSDLLTKAGTLAMGTTPSLELINRMMAACDQDHDRVIDFEEFVAAVSLKLKIPAEKPVVVAAPVTAAPKREEEARTAADGDESDEQTGAAASTAAAADDSTSASAGSQVVKIVGHDAVFNDKGLIDKKGARAHLVKLEYTTETLSNEALEEIFAEQDKDGDNFLTVEQYKEMLVGLGEF